MLVVHGTKKFLDRVSGPRARPDDQSTTAMGDWYSTVLFWRPQVALFVNEATLFPVLVPFAPAASVVRRFTASLLTVLHGQDVRPSFVRREIEGMSDHRLTKTSNRSVIGIMSEFTFLADAFRDHHGDNDLLTMALWLAKTPCGPLRNRAISPDRELAALVARLD